uniref:Ribosomal_L18e/L15P domain-containing protein n=1 Tax=Heterorhabditis bacteriophora TaxID=37862 RepID=A0A1I7W663_HETBA
MHILMSIMLNRVLAVFLLEMEILLSVSSHIYSSRKTFGKSLKKIFITVVGARNGISLLEMGDLATRKLKEKLRFRCTTTKMVMFSCFLRKILLLRAIFLLILKKLRKKYYNLYVKKKPNIRFVLLQFRII